MQKSTWLILIALLVGAAAWWYFKTQRSVQPMVETTEQKSVPAVALNDQPAALPQEAQKVADAAMPQMPTTEASKVAEAVAPQAQPAQAAPAQPVTA